MTGTPELGQGFRELFRCNREPLDPLREWRGQVCTWCESWRPGEETAVERENAGDLQRVPPRRQLGAGRRVPVGKGPSTGETYSV